ncbi:MAG: hypothetical protein M3P24_04300 [Gemmatimonadota bacterium]|nr:hypothetical protein [Gemmatimonadota bacterium]
MNRWLVIGGAAALLVWLVWGRDQEDDPARSIPYNPADAVSTQRAISSRPAAGIPLPTAAVYLPPLAPSGGEITWPDNGLPGGAYEPDVPAEPWPGSSADANDPVTWGGNPPRGSVDSPVWDQPSGYDDPLWRRPQGVEDPRWDQVRPAGCDPDAYSC